MSAPIVDRFVSDRSELVRLMAVDPRERVEMRAQLHDCFPEDEAEIGELCDVVLADAVIRQFGSWHCVEEVAR